MLLQGTVDQNVIAKAGFHFFHASSVCYIKQQCVRANKDGEILKYNSRKCHGGFIFKQMPGHISQTEINVFIWLISPNHHLFYPTTISLYISYLQTSIFWLRRFNVFLWANKGSVGSGRPIFADWRATAPILPSVDVQEPRRWSGAETLEAGSVCVTGERMLTHFLFSKN